MVIKKLTPIDIEINKIVEKGKALDSLCPSSKQFYKNSNNEDIPIMLPGKKKNPKIPDLVEIHSTINKALNSAVQSGEKSKLNKAKETSPIVLTDIRNRIKKLRDKFPNSPEIRALNAYMLYIDLKQSGENFETKLLTFKKAKMELVLAINSGYMPLKPVFWFTLFYKEFLQKLEKRSKEFLENLENREDYRIASNDQVVEIRKKIQHNLEFIRDQLNYCDFPIKTIRSLVTSIHGKMYFGDKITEAHLRKASDQIFKGETSQKIDGRHPVTLLEMFYYLNKVLTYYPFFFERIITANTKQLSKVQKTVVLIRGGIFSSLISVKHRMAKVSSYDRTEAENLVNENERLSRQLMDDAGFILAKEYEIRPFITHLDVLQERVLNANSSQQKKRLLLQKMKILKNLTQYNQNPAYTNFIIKQIQNTDRDLKIYDPNLSAL